MPKKGDVIKGCSVSIFLFYCLSDKIVKKIGKGGFGGGRAQAPLFPLFRAYAFFNGEWSFAMKLSCFAVFQCISALYTKILMSPHAQSSLLVLKNKLLHTRR
jgi:hypothetical protein